MNGNDPYPTLTIDQLILPDPDRFGLILITDRQPDKKITGREMLVGKLGDVVCLFFCDLWGDKLQGFKIDQVVPAELESKNGRNGVYIIAHPCKHRTAKLFEEAFAAINRENNRILQQQAAIEERAKKIIAEAEKRAAAIIAEAEKQVPLIQEEARQMHNKARRDTAGIRHEITELETTRNRLRTELTAAEEKLAGDQRRWEEGDAILRDKAAELEEATRHLRPENRFHADSFFAELDEIEQTATV
ncbi:MAG: hypothetical protein JW816_03505 [Candidatus Buchananbacteria bacterium]|nr:hypothetical protein [Candidatus Buchananbacteria bacterium]